MVDVAQEHRSCNAAITLAFSILGKRWNGVIVGALEQGPASFVVLRRAIGGISDTVLSERLGELAEAGLVRRTVTEGPPVSVSYELTPGGAELTPLLDQIGEWARKNMRRPGAE
ncbi:winged helix-turn-helix transcriptional regulator [Amnibacterium flavum]|uniref:Transcriptional regulator n=1 Tax=Amnibacterium flavum TaxID=2173173 RepID=A0A2V1HRP5_9MICO|nr:helix-turn-helix domain-containing protein [Amnibacterium flavum]PVZ95255.1 transcriptional regulator [Amnibacterium flavum]